MKSLNSLDRPFFAVDIEGVAAIKSQISRFFHFLLSSFPSYVIFLHISCFLLVSLHEDFCLNRLLTCNFIYLFMHAAGTYLNIINEYAEAR